MVFLGVMLLSFMATHTPLVEKVAVIRHQLGLAEGLNVADTVAEAVKQLGLVGEVAGRDLIQRADACLVMLRLPAETMPTPEQAAEVRSALDCKRLGYSVSQCKDRGFTAVQCKEAGYSAAELNDKGRLWQEEFERMVQEAEEFSDEDKKVREKIEARNALENYVYSMKNTLNDSEKGVADKISDDDNDYAARRELQHAFYFTRDGMPLVYTDGNYHAGRLEGSGGAFPRHANTAFLGQFGDTRLPNLAYLHQHFARGSQRPRWSDNDFVAYERIDKRENPGMSDDAGVVSIVLLNDNYAGDMDLGTVQARGVNTGPDADFDKRRLTVQARRQAKMALAAGQGQMSKFEIRSGEDVNQFILIDGVPYINAQAPPHTRALLHQKGCRFAQPCRRAAAAQLGPILR